MFVPTVRCVGRTYRIVTGAKFKRDTKFKTEAFSSEPEEFSCLRVSHRLLKESHDVEDLLKKEGMVDVETLETFRAKKRGPGSRMCISRLLARWYESWGEDGVPFRFRELGYREHVFNPLNE